MSTDKIVKSADRVVELLELLTARGEPLALSDIVAELSIPKSSAHALLKTLQFRGLLVCGNDGRYQTSTKWLGLVSRALESASGGESVNLRQAAYPIMLRLSEDLGMTCNLAVLDGDSVVYVDKVHPRTSALNLNTHIGARLPASATGLGKSLLAGLDTESLEEWIRTYELRSLTPKSIVRVPELRRALEETAKLGYAVDDEESHEGVVCVAASISDYRNQVMASISVSGLKGKVGRRGIGVVGGKVRSAADHISGEIGGVEFLERVSS